MAAPRENKKKQKGGNKCGAPRGRQQTVHHASAAEKKKKRGGASSVSQTERSSLSPGPWAWSPPRTLPANASSIMCGAWSHFTANKQRTRLRADAAYEGGGGAEAVKLPLRLIRDSVRTVREGEEKCPKFLFFFLLNVLSTFFMSPPRSSCHFYNQLYCVSATCFPCYYVSHLSSKRQDETRLYYGH